MRHLLVLSMGIALAATAAAVPVRAQGGPDAMLTLRPCPPGSVPAGAARFQNIGNRDLNEGAPNYIAIRLCTEIG